MDELQQLVLNVYRLAQEADAEAFQPLALGLVRPVLRFDSCRWGTALTCTTQRLIFEQVHLENEAPGIMDAYAEVAELDEMGLDAAAHPGHTINFNARQLYGGRPSHAAFLDYLSRFRHENLLVTGMVSPHRTAKSLSFYRAGRDDHFSERERQAGEAIFPHMMEALSINLTLDLARFKDHAGPARWPMAMCGAGGVVLHAEPEFDALLAQQWRQAAPRRLPQAVTEALLVQRKHQCLAERVLVCVSQRMAGVVYLKARARQPVDALTERELQVARLVARGMSFKEIAAALHLAPATVRNHIQRIHERLAIRSNAELASRLAHALP